MPDRQTETWILHDWCLIQQKSGKTVAKPAEIEGMYGKQILKKIFPDYSETIMGADLLRAINPALVFSQ